MDLSDLINKLGNININKLESDDIITKIINFMYESAEEGLNQYKYYYNISDNIHHIMNQLITYFPDLNIHHYPNDRYIFIDWS